MKAKQIAALLLIGTLTLTGCANQVDMSGKSAVTQADTSQTGSEQTEAGSEQTDSTPTEAGSAQSEAAGSSDAAGKAYNIETVQAENSYTTAGINVNLIGDYSDKALSTEWSLEDATVITLSDAGITVDGDGAKAADGVVTISAKGTYVLEGSISSGQIVVDAEDKNVTLVLNGVSIISNADSPIYVKQAKNVYVTLADGTENSIIDNRSAKDADSTAAQSADSAETEEGTAAIYSKDDLIFNGSGTLYVKGGYKDGITGKDDLQIISGTITIEAADDGIVGKDSVSIRGGSIHIDAGDDGIKSTNEETDKGYLVVDGGSIQITSGSKGIDTVNVIVVNDGVINIDSVNEGMESLNVVLNGGEVSVKAGDDGINIANGSGSAQITGSDQMPENGSGNTQDGAASNSGIPQMPENGSDNAQYGQKGQSPRGNFDGAQNGERPHRGGFKGAQNGTAPNGDMPQMPDTSTQNAPNDQAPVGQTLAARAGDVQNTDALTSNDVVSDVANADAASTETMQNLRGGMPGQGRQGGFGGMMDETIDGALVINGGIVTVDAQGDGLDSNGNIQINGGYTIVSATKTGGNGALDYNGICEINGGVLLLTSSGDMEQRGSADSKQKTAYVNLSSALPAGSEIQILDSAGNVLYTFTNAKECRYVAVSAPEVTENASIQIMAGGNTMTAGIGQG